MPTYVIGDPQAPFAKVLEVLDRHGVLAPGKDRIADGVTLVSIGDHFDFNVEAPAEAAVEGLRTLRWLASHDPAQAVLLFGNHDAARVMELACIDDDTFQSARVLGREIDQIAKTVGPKAAKDREREFSAAFPALPSSGVIARDYASFTTEQRALVMELLLAGRFSLARTCVLEDGRAALLTHAGVTNRELAMLGIEFASEPTLIATTLAQFFADAIDRVRPAWSKGELAPLSLAPLHVTGSEGEEGGGLLYHRPTNPASSRIDLRWAANGERPRRFDPRELPQGVTQVVGHTGHAKCTFELAAWSTEAARARKRGGIRTLRVTGTSVVYDIDVLPPAHGVTDMIFTDGELRRLPAHEVPLLRVDRVT
ncbi:MAG: metallophosphoesterase [Kofleriaceae bacterium]